MPRRPPCMHPGLVLALAVGSAATAQAQTLVVQDTLLVFSAVVGAPPPPSQSDSLTGLGGRSLTWQLASGNQLAPWLSVTPNGGGTPTILGVAVNPAGLRPGTYTDTVRIASNAPANPTQLIQVLLVVSNLGGGSGGGAASGASGSAASASGAGAASGPGGGGVPAALRKYLATYDIELTFVGYTGLVEGAPNCAVDTLGYDTIVGTVSGLETPARDEDVAYQGTLRRKTKIDFCETKGKKNPNDDERVWCTATLTGLTVSDVELTVYGESGRGGYLKVAPGPGPTGKRVASGCDPTTDGEILSDYPGGGDGGGASPNGQPIDDPQSQLFAGGLARLRVGTFPAQGPQGGWTLRVIRRIP